MSRLWVNDEELAKKDDDLKAPRPGRLGGQWQGARRPRRSSIARLVAYAVAVILVIVTLTRLMSSTPEAAISRPPAGGDPETQPPPAANAVPQPPPEKPPSSPRAKDRQVEQAPAYNGPLKLPSLGQTLQAIGRTGGRQTANRNVLFAAASLDSASTLLPLACRMASERQNYVHFAFIGRSDIPLKTLLAVNGIDPACQMILHDGRPDNPGTSTERRMALAAARALKYIYLYMHPQAIIVDATADEEKYFLSGLRDQVRSMAVALIELPENPNTRMSWITKLDSSSLAAWDKVHVDILIQAPSRGAGNLGRLLRSLAKVDLGAMSIPHLTIELPNFMEPLTEKLLAAYQWPPPTTIDGHRPHMLSLRHRIPRKKLSEEESSVRFLESFWPQSPLYSHVLVLSPHTEVTPQFLHYVKYSLLHYKYSNAATVQSWSAKMMGLSFVAPTGLLDGASSFTPPEPSDDAGSSYLWQAPSSDAMLFSGAKWMELHGYVSRILERQESWSDSPGLLSVKDVSKKYPTWLEYVLQLSRLRGYFTIYPGQETSSAIMGVHNDIPDVPEEYADDKQAILDAMGNPAEDEATYNFDSHWQVDMLQTLPRDGSLPSVESLPVVSWDGKAATAEDLIANAREFATRFRSEVGNCRDGDTPSSADRFARDLFCTAKDKDDS